jgi:2'-5' RNA ligase superfamily
VSEAHSVLLVRVRAADPIVAAFGQLAPPEWDGEPYAHVTALGPFVPRAAVTSALTNRIDAVTQAVRPFGARFARIDTFPDGTVWLAPDHPGQFVELTNALWRAFPSYPPYGGQFDEVIPHLSLGRLPSVVGFDAVASLIGPLLPVRTTVDALELVWWSAERVDVLREWPLVGL